MNLDDLFVVNRTHIAQRVPSPQTRFGAGKYGLAVLDGALLVQSARVLGAGAGCHDMHFDAVCGAGVELVGGFRGGDGGGRVGMLRGCG